MPADAINDVSARIHAASWLHARDAKFVADRNSGLIVDANPAAESLLGFSRDELVGMSFLDLHPAFERAAVDAFYARAAGAQEVITGFHVRHRDGGIIPVEISSSATFSLDGRSFNVGVLHDATEKQQHQRIIARQNWALAVYAGTALAVTRSASAEDLMTATCEAVTHEKAYVLAWVGMADTAPGLPIRYVAKAGGSLGYLDGLHLSWSADDPHGQGPTGTALRTGRIHVLGDAATDPEFLPWRARAARFDIASSVAIPFSTDGGQRGVLAVYSRYADAFDSGAIEVLSTLASEFTRGLGHLERKTQLEQERRHREETQERLARSLTAAVSAIAATMELRDPYTAGHQSRVAELARAIGEEMGFAEDQLKGLHLAATVHDVGKIAVPIEILTKPTPLSAAERSMLQEHAHVGYTILRPIPFPWPIADIVRQHHEKLDGTGYPLGLRGEQILPEARVLAVADIMEAMSSFRPYRLARGLDAALKEIQQKAGTELDADAVRACVRLFRDKNYRMPERPPT